MAFVALLSRTGLHQNVYAVIQLHTSAVNSQVHWERPASLKKIGERYLLLLYPPHRSPIVICCLLISGDKPMRPAMMLSHSAIPTSFSLNLVKAVPGAPVLGLDLP